MSLNGHRTTTTRLPGTVPLPPPPTPSSYVPLPWVTDAEHADRRREADADAALHDAPPFPVDRRVLKDIVREKTHADVGRITFLSAGKHVAPPIARAQLTPVQARFIKSVAFSYPRLLTLTRLIRRI